MGFRDLENLVIKKVEKQRFVALLNKLIYNGNNEYLPLMRTWQSNLSYELLQNCLLVIGICLLPSQHSNQRIPPAEENQLSMFFRGFSLTIMNSTY